MPGEAQRVAPLPVPPLLQALGRVLQRRAGSYKLPPPRPNRRAAGVLAAFFERQGELRLLFFRRTDTAPTHKGQVAFPGGSGEPADADLEATALREAHEELGIDPATVVMLGGMHPFDTFVSNFEVHPFCGWLTIPGPEFVPQPSEVEDVLEVPVQALRLKKNKKLGRVPGFNVPIPLPYYRIGDVVIWGATGGIVAELLECLEEAEALLGSGG